MQRRGPGHLSMGLSFRYTYYVVCFLFSASTMNALVSFFAHKHGVPSGLVYRWCPCLSEINFVGPTECMLIGTFSFIKKSLVEIGRA